MKHFFLLATLIASLTISLAIAAQSDLTYTCIMDTMTRTISVEYTTDAPTPCSVIYVKDDDTTETLWSAKNVDGYCENKAREFIEKQRSWGWQCSSDNVVAAKSHVYY